MIIRIDELATVNIASRALEKMVCPDDFCKAGFNRNGGGGAGHGAKEGYSRPHKDG